jgi:hypothetical protein
VTDEQGEDVDVFDRAEAGRSVGQDQRWIKLPPSSMLSIEDADAMLRWRPASLIAVVGERNGGKTTLVTEIYERFLRGSFGGMLFAHSLSLLGFERKSFRSRAESGAELPDTPRTSKQEGLRMFHLAVADEDHLRRTDLLVSERAGEVYREIRDQPARAEELLEVRKAATVALVIDGQRVLDDRRRAEVLASVRNVLRALADGGMIASGAQVQLVTTKCDLLDANEAAVARDALGEFEERMAASYAERFGAIEAFRTAARDPSGVVEPARGLAPLLRSWLRPRPETVTEPLSLPPLIDEFDRLLLRRMA